MKRFEPTKLNERVCTEIFHIDIFYIVLIIKKRKKFTNFDLNTEIKEIYQVKMLSRMLIFNFINLNVKNKDYNIHK